MNDQAAAFKTLVFTDPQFARHDPGPGHPEQSARAGAYERGWRQVASCEERPIAPTDEAAIWALAESLHTREYLDSLKQAHAKLSAEPGTRLSLDADTHIMSESLPAALKAVAGAMQAVDALIAGEAPHAYLAARPPGHHAETDRAMGFCLLSTAALAARYAQQAHGKQRCVVLDFDVHHGNGTQACFWNHADLMLVSSHQMPLYPGTGEASERGAHGQIVNLPLAEGCQGPEFRRVWTSALERVRAFAPDFIVVSAGFDAHRDDPLAGLQLDEDDFAWCAQAIEALARGLGTPGLLSCQEGGYNLQALERCVAAYLGGFSR